MVLATGCRSGTDQVAGTAPALTSWSSRGASPGTATARPGHTGDGRALTVLRAWDSRRSQAFAADDEHRLRRLYAAGSPLAEQDLAVLRDYRQRGVRLLQAEQQVVSVEVHDASPREVTMTVVERLAASRVGLADDANGTTTAPERALPASAFTRRVLRFEHARGGWRLSWASEA